MRLPSGRATGNGLHTDNPKRLGKICRRHAGGGSHGREAHVEVQHLAQVKAVGSNPTPLSISGMGSRWDFLSYSSCQGVKGSRRETGAPLCRCSSMAEHLFPKQDTRVRFPSPAPAVCAGYRNTSSNRESGRTGRCHSRCVYMGQRGVVTHPPRGCGKRWFDSSLSRKFRRKEGLCVFQRIVQSCV